jgi:hypothetical protein
MFSRDPVAAVVSNDKPGPINPGHPNAYRTNLNITLDTSVIAADGNGRKKLPAHIIWGRYGSGYKPAPYAKVTAAFSTGAATGTISPELAVLFKANDVLRTVAPSGTVTLAATWAANDIVNVVINGRTTTVTAANGVLADIAVQVAAAINANPLVNQLVVAIASGAVVFIYAENGITNYTLTTSVTVAGNGTAAASGAALASGAAIGTIQSVNYTTGVITLTGNAGVAVPIGASIHVPADDLVGIYQFSTDMTNKPYMNFALITECNGYYEQSVPQFDEFIRHHFAGKIEFRLKG